MPWQVASWVQASAPQGMPVFVGVTEHVPVPGWQCSAALHAPSPGHDATAQHTPSTQCPLMHASSAVQASPSIVAWTNT